MSLIIAYLGIVFVLAIALNARFLGELFGLMDDPMREKHKQHILPTPLVGALMVGVLASFIIVNQYFFDSSTRLIGVSVCTILIAVLGVVDDRKQLSWQSRILIIGGISALLVYWVPEMRLQNLIWSFGRTTVLGEYVGAGFAVLCLMTIVISVNMMDGFNGGVIGTSAILFLIMALVATNPHRQAICLFLSSALGVMFIYNMKGEFFLGDGGAYALGLLLGAVALLTYNVEANITIYADTVFVWFALPTLDCLRVVVTRKLNKASPFHASRDHLHHILVDVTGPKRTTLIYALIVSIYGTLTLISDDKTYIVLLAEFLTLGFLMFTLQRLREEPV